MLDITMEAKRYSGQSASNFQDRAANVICVPTLRMGWIMAKTVNVRRCTLRSCWGVRHLWPFSETYRDKEFLTMLARLENTARVNIVMNRACQIVVGSIVVGLKGTSNFNDRNISERRTSFYIYS